MIPGSLPFAASPAARPLGAVPSPPACAGDAAKGMPLPQSARVRFNAIWSPPDPGQTAEAAL
jgi:hypothetical protein